MAICGFDYAIRIILLHLYVHKCQVLNMYVSSHPVYLCFIISFWFVSFHVVARLLWLTFFLYICLFLFKRIIKNCAGCISHAGEQIYTSTRTRSLAHSHARQSYCIFHVISYKIFTQTRRTHLPYPVITWFMCMCVLFLYFIYYSSFVLRFPLFNSSISIRNSLCVFAVLCCVMTLNSSKHKHKHFECLTIVHFRNYDRKR